jgi:pseudouridine-5'-phosphate glycosidase
VNLDTGLAAEQAVRTQGATPATVAILGGTVRIGLSREEQEYLSRSTGILKASRRDVAAALAQNRDAATTVSATMMLAHQAGIAVFATGGLGGAHRPPADPWDISADLNELARTPMIVVCTGAKSILNLPRTLEILETLGVPVLGYQTDHFPEFTVRSQGLPVSARVESPQDVARVFLRHRALGGGAVVVANPLSEELTVDAKEYAVALAEAEANAKAQGIAGARLTPYLLAELSRRTAGKTLSANQQLIIRNARLAAEVAMALVADERMEKS